ncbi:hypothetical protein BGX26_006344, partial [Mortierella sp. AD094]
MSNQPTSNVPKNPMTPGAAARLQAAHDRNPGNHDDFYKRSQADAARNKNNQGQK